MGQKCGIKSPRDSAAKKIGKKCAKTPQKLTKIEVFNAVRAWQRTRASARSSVNDLARRVGRKPSAVQALLNACPSRRLRRLQEKSFVRQLDPKAKVTQVKAAAPLRTPLRSLQRWRKPSRDAERQQRAERNEAARDANRQLAATHNMTVAEFFDESVKIGRFTSHRNLFG